ncbi:thiol-disulfide oxidoreductase ResA [Bacillus spongiae]|uniref:Thiol-disulfide oxidoreductase ResA n=1 Tax=Bacillus spongiae TaxID=2683610 RepID=A0ABU8HD67_9BACI
MQKKKNRLLMRSAILVILLLAVGYTLYAATTKESREAIKAGQVAPDFVLTDLGGESHKLSDYQGQGVFLNFWGTYCPPCEKEMPAMNSQYNVYKDQGVQILAVNVGESDYQVKKFVDKYKLDFPVLIDKEEDVKQAYGVFDLPVTFLINPDGEIERILKGELSEQTISEHMEKIKP